MRVMLRKGIAWSVKRAFLQAVRYDCLLRPRTVSKCLHAYHVVCSADYIQQPLTLVWHGWCLHHKTAPTCRGSLPLRRRLVSAAVACSMIYAEKDRPLSHADEYAFANSASCRKGQPLSHADEYPFVNSAPCRKGSAPSYAKTKNLLTCLSSMYKKLPSSQVPCKDVVCVFCTKTQLHTKDHNAQNSIRV